jgi:hypothetical protein
MDRDALRDQAPTDDAFAPMNSVRKQEVTVDLALAFLDACETDGRQPDVWESYYLRGALGALYTNWFALAETEVLKAIAAPEDRAPGWEAQLAHEVPPIEAFRTAFQDTRYRPVPPN